MRYRTVNNLGQDTSIIEGNQRSRACLNASIIVDPEAGRADNADLCVPWDTNLAVGD